MGKKVAILQSNYIPWKGYFDIINRVDEFILFDDAQYTRNDWRNRNKIKTPSGPLWLTIPVRRNFGQKIIESKVESGNWAEKHWKSIKNNYAKAPYFDSLASRFETAYQESGRQLYLSRINHAFISLICELLGVKTKISWSMDYEIGDGKTERLVSLCQQVEGTEYVSGPAAKDYLDEDAFASAGIKLAYMDYSGYPEYPQLFPPFVHEVSVIDLIFNTGNEALKYIKSI